MCGLSLVATCTTKKHNHNKTLNFEVQLLLIQEEKHKSKMIYVSDEYDKADESVK